MHRRRRSKRTFCTKALSVHSKIPPQPIESVVLESAAGLRVTLLNLGATIQSIQVPTAVGAVDVILGFTNHDDYWADSEFLGSTVGRFANRIQGAGFSLGGRTYQLDANETSTGHCLHGGRAGFHKQFWTLEPTVDGTSAVCRYVSPDGDGGFPGNLEVSVTYQLDRDCRLVIDYRATADRDTVVSLANHAYFNLDRDQCTIDTHQISIDAASFTPVDEGRIPTGELRDVSASGFDLRQSTAIGDGVNGLQFDHNFVLPESAGRLRRAAELYSPNSGLRLRVHTTQPGLQLYTGDHLTGPFHSRQGLCLEAQGFPDAPNQPTFPSARLAVGGLYRQTTIYEFLADKS